MKFIAEDTLEFMQTLQLFTKSIKTESVFKSY